MDEFMKKPQVLKLFIIAALLIITPLLSSSLRSTYLYFIVNILVVIVGAEAGLLSFFLHSPQNKKPAIIPDDREEKAEAYADQFGKNDGPTTGPNKALEKCCSDKVNVGEVKDQKVKRSLSTPSIFFIGGGEAEDRIDDVRVDEDDEGGGGIGEISGQELFHKAETFIGNFYKQLKMQREESWKKLHDLYQKAF